jgi:hypothetical protein
MALGARKTERQQESFVMGGIDHRDSYPIIPRFGKEQGADGRGQKQTSGVLQGQAIVAHARK